MKTVLLKLAGPLQSWGSNSHFETRHTDLYPSKSAVLGIVAASLGLRRNETGKMQRLNELDFAVRIDQVGNVVRDYQTVKKYKPNGILDKTYVTNRYYLEDAVILVAITHESDEFMEEIANALDNPYFQPYMGRRSCPMTTDYMLGVFNGDESAVDLLRRFPWQAAHWYQKRNKGRLLNLEIFADSHLMNANNYFAMRKDKVLSFSQTHREFAFRKESKDWIRLDLLSDADDGAECNVRSTSHDFWDAVIE